MEKRVLDEIIKEFFYGKRIYHFDFACGTGRILTYLENRVVCSIGVDISSSMLEIAYKKVKKSKIIKEDLTHHDVLGKKMFNFITAFRFFPNAQPLLRSQVMDVLIKHLTTDGYIVFNNHKNASSLIYHISRIFARGGKDGMHQIEINKLVSAAGLKIEKVYHIGLLPSTEKHLLFPRFILIPIEKIAMNFKMFRNFSQNLIFVCSHAT